MSETEYSRLKDAVNRIAMDEEAGQRIIQNCKRINRHNYRIRKGMLAAAFTICFLLTVVIMTASLKGNDTGIVVYAATEEGSQWIKLERGKKKLFLDNNYCIFQIELPENYLYQQQGMSIGNDYVRTEGNTIYYHISEEEGVYGLPSQMTGTIRINIVDDKGKWVKTILLEITREDNECFAELKYEK